MTAYGHGPYAADSLDPTYRRLTGLTSRSVLITETGADGPARADWVASFGDYLAAHDRIRGFVWFNTSPDSTGASGDYGFNTTPTSARAFARMLAELNLDEPGLARGYVVAVAVLGFLAVVALPWGTSLQRMTSPRPGSATETELSRNLLDVW